MSFQAYLTTVETKSDPTPRRLLKPARGKGFGTEAGPMIDWLKEEYGLGRVHAMTAGW